MALRLWLPLNGSLVNQGLDDYETTTLGTISWVNGKIGKALSAGTASQTQNGVSINSNLTDVLSNDYSVAVWVKPLGNHVHYNGTIMSSGNWNNTRWAFGLSQDNTKVDVLSNGHNTYIDCPIPVNEWTHICCVRTSDKLVSLYKNGEYVNSIRRDDYPSSDATNTTVGRETYARGYFSFNGNINDLRLYDHALSLKEIKELSKGLVLHYPLSRVGGDNLLSHYVSTGANGPSSTATGGRTQYYGDYGIIIPAIENADTYFSLFLVEPLTQNKTYTISCNASGLLSGTFYNFPLFSQSNGAMGYLKINHNGLCSLTFTMTYDTQPEFSVDGRTVYRCFMDDVTRNLASGQGTITLTNFKIEEGDKATPWLPNKNETAYIKAGFNNNIEYDVSGYRNNGTIVGSLEYSSDTPRYLGSTYFNGGDNAITVPFNFAISDSTIPFTINLWFKKTEIGTDGYESLFGGPSGFEMDTRSGSATSLSLYMASTRGGAVYSPFNLNEWYMVTMASDRTNEYYYVNGELVKTITAKSMPVGSYFIGAWNAYNKQNYKGLISDFRIYSTCLSPTDILALYNTPISIANNGILLT